MQGEEGVVFVIGEEIVLRQGQLHTEQQGEQTANQEEEEPEQEVHDADFFVVGGGQPRLEEAPEALHGEGLGGPSVEHPEHAHEDETSSQTN